MTSASGKIKEYTSFSQIKQAAERTTGDYPNRDVVAELLSTNPFREDEDQGHSQNLQIASNEAEEDDD